MLVTSTILALLALTGTATATSDTTATHAYLQSTYELDQAVLRSAPAARSALTTTAERIGNECHGVLAGEPRENEGPPSEDHETPRARGERERSEIQQRAIEGELDQTIFSALDQPDRAAIEAFAGQVAPLSWSDPRIAPLVHIETSRLEELLSPPLVDVCADMKAWAQSGYHRLSPASREFEATQEARSKRIVPGGSLKSLLKPFEGPRERALIRQIHALRPKLAHALVGFSQAIARLKRALGVPEDPFEERAREPVLGRGVTHAGTTFTVRPEPTGGPFGHSCRHPVGYEFEERTKNSSSGSGSSVCLGDRSERQPSGSCGRGVATITAVVPASVRTVRLLLSNGQTISSRVVRIPKRYGGPGGIYLQAVRGYSPYPVSLTELDRNGHIVAIKKLGKIRCTREPPGIRGPVFVDLATGTAPGGQPFTIQASIVHFGRGQTSFGLDLGIGVRGSSEDGASNEGIPKAFPWSVGYECAPHEFSVVYGILAAPGDSVLARTPEGLVSLTKVTIAAKLHSGGPLVYGAFSTLPTELIVRRSDGSTLYTESLVAKGKEDAAFCVGFAEQ
jgi:hypothetical protein